MRVFFAFEDFTFFLWRAFYNARQKATTAEGGRNARFFAFFARTHTKKLYMIGRELEFVVVRMY